MRRKLVVLAVATLVAVVLAEVVARVALDAYATSIYALDDACLHRLIPGARKLFVHEDVNGGHVVEVAVNSAGYRGPELGAGRARLAVFGDSFVMAEFSPVEATFVSRLADALELEGVNAGVVGYGPDQCLVRIERELAELRPALLVVGVYAGNDFGDLIRNKLFRADAELGLVPAGAVIGDRLREEFAGAHAASMLVRLARKVRRRWRDADAWVRLRERDAATRREFATRMPAVWLRECEDEFRELVVDRDLTVRNLLRDHYDADVSLVPDGAAASHKIALMDAVLGRLAAAARTAGVPLCIVAIPSAVDVCDAYEAGQVAVDEFPRYERGRLTRLVAELARGHGVPVVDLFGPFREGGRDALYFRPPDGHWNDAAQTLAAELVAERVRALLRD